MDEFNKKRITDLIKTDLLTMSGGKNKNTTLYAFIMMGFIFLLGGFIISPMAGAIVPTIIGAVIVSEITANERKSHCEKMFSVLPVGRKELVQSRFVFVTAVTVALCVAVYLLMLLSLKLKLYVIISDNTDFLGLMSEMTGGVLTELGGLNIIYSLGTAAGLACAGSTLRSYFKNGDRLGETDDPLGDIYGGKKRRLSAGEKALLILCYAVIIVFFLAISGMVQILAPVSLIIALFMKLAQAANGALLSAVFLTQGAFSLVYAYVCSVIEYEDKDI